MYDRDPLSPEINPFLSGLKNGSISREQVFEKLQYSEEFNTARDLLLVGKTLHGTWRSVPASLAATNQFGYGSMSGGGGNSEAAQAAMGMPYIANENNFTDLGFYEGVEDDHGNFLSTGTWIDMNEPEVMSIMSYSLDSDVFKIKSQNLENEGKLIITLDQAPYGKWVPYRFLAAGGSPDESVWKLRVVFNDGTFVDTEAQEARETGSATRIIQFDLAKFRNVNYYAFEIYKGYNNTYGGILLSLENSAYLNQANFLTDAEIGQLQIESRVNNFSLAQSASYQANNFVYTNKYGQIETHDPESFFNRLFRNKYEQDPNPTQSSRGVNLLKDGRTQLQFLQDFALENNVVTVGGYNYTTSEAQLAIPNVPLDAAAFAENRIDILRPDGEAPSNDQVALLTMTPRMEVRPLSQRAELILDMPEYAKQYGVAKPEIDFIGIQNGQTFSGGEQISVEASSLGVDDLGGTVDDGEIHTVELFLNGKSMGLMTEPATGEFFYTLSLASTLTAGEYQLEAVAEDVNGLMSRAQRMIRITSNQSMELEITSPTLGTTLEVGDTVEVNFSQNESTSITNSFLEINGKVQWSAVLSLDGLETPGDEHNFSINDGTGRGPVTFEFDTDGLASETVIENPENIIGTEGLASTGEYIGVESREYLIEIDSEIDISRSFHAGP